MEIEINIIKKIAALSHQFNLLEQACNRNRKCTPDVLQEIHYLNLRLLHLHHALKTPDEKIQLDDREPFKQTLWL